MTHQEIKVRLTKDQIVFTSAILYNMLRKRMNKQDNNIMIENFVNSIMDMMFERNMPMCMDAKESNPIHMNKFDSLVYDCVKSILHTKFIRLDEYIGVQK